MSGVATTLGGVLLLGALAACTAATPVSTRPASTVPVAPPIASSVAQPTPTPLLQPLPSNACGGFHLAIHNRATNDVAVTINQGAAVAIKPDETITLVEWLPGPVDLPLMPWTLTLTRASDGELIGTEPFNSGEADTSLTVTDTGVESASESLCRN